MVQGGSVIPYYESIYHVHLLVTRTETGKTTVIRRIAVRETGVSRHHEGTIAGPLKNLGSSQHSIVKMWLRGTLNWFPLCRETR